MHKRTTALLMALVGVFFFLVFLAQDLSHFETMSLGDLPLLLILRYAVAMTLGGALSGLVFAGLFGRGGVGGWILALLGGLVAALLSGLFGSAVALLPDLLADGYHPADLLRVLLGTLVLPLSLAEQPLLGLVLLALIAAAHLLARRARRNGPTAS
jgi:hypothetical protein